MVVSILLFLFSFPFTFTFNGMEIQLNVEDTRNLLLDLTNNNVLVDLYNKQPKIDPVFTDALNGCINNFILFYFILFYFTSLNC